MWCVDILHDQSAAGRAPALPLPQIGAAWLLFRVSALLLHSYLGSGPPLDYWCCFSSSSSEGWTLAFLAFLESCRSGSLSCSQKTSDTEVANVVREGCRQRFIHKRVSLYYRSQMALATLLPMQADTLNKQTHSHCSQLWTSRHSHSGIQCSGGGWFVHQC